jgi:hypothetical protein
MSELSQNAMSAGDNIAAVKFFGLGLHPVQETSDIRVALLSGVNY